VSASASVPVSNPDRSLRLGLHRHARRIFTDRLPRDMTDESADPGAVDVEGDATPGEYGDGAVEGVFLVTAADDASAVLRNVDTGQVHALGSNPGVEADDAVEGVVAPQPPMEVAWALVEVRDRWTLTLEAVDESPTAQAREAATGMADGELTRLERAGEGELHVIAVDDAEAAVADVLDDREAVLARAARLGVARVRIRSQPGLVVVRYLP
jgi:hypothetical protein